MDLNEILKALGGLSLEQQESLYQEALAATKDRLWVPNPGPQTEALLSEADELFYGGQAGGGKSDLEIGLALTEHHRSLILRRTNKEALGLVERIAEIVGNRDGWSGQQGIWRFPERTIEVSGCQLEEDKQKFKGSPHDLICMDEVSDFSRTQYEFITAWNRSTKAGQRCRIIAAGNPPTRPEGLWVLQRWAAWLDPRHPNPAKPGELRWYTTGDDGHEIEVDGPGPHLVGGEYVIARSRTFIPARLDDNPDLAATNYAATLAALPPELRAAYRDGRFDLGLQDGAYQVVPTSWIKAAQQRWTPQPPANVPMCTIGVDVAQGGTDSTVLAIRHDGWFAPMIAVPGHLTPTGSSVAGLVVQHRRDAAVVIIDMGGGYGGSALERLRDNQIETIGHKGAEASGARTKDRQFHFVNKRSEILWRFREALDPDQEGGSPIMLPDDPALVADLTAPTFEVVSRGIKVESKEDVCKRLGRSTDRGDAVVMAWSAGLRAANIQGGFQALARNRTPKVVMGHQQQRRRT